MLSPLCKMLLLSQDTGGKSTPFVAFQSIKNWCGVLAPEELFFLYSLHVIGCAIQFNRKNKSVQIKDKKNKTTGGSRSHDVYYLYFHFIDLVSFVADMKVGITLEIWC